MIRLVYRQLNLSSSHFALIAASTFPVKSPLATIRSFGFQAARMASGEVDLRSMRKPYKGETECLLESDLPTTDPIKLFGVWFAEAKECQRILEPNAVCLATADKNGIPSARMVLLKGFGPDGFKVFTNYSSRKGKDLLENPNASLLFFWDQFNKQIRIEGTVEQLSEEEGLEYFQRRPKISQLAAAASEQSAPIDSRETLVEKYNQLEEMYAETSVPKPQTWGGFRVVPKRFEFWQGQTSRLHDRIIFDRERVSNENDGQVSREAENGWFMKRLQP